MSLPLQFQPKQRLPLGIALSFLAFSCGNADPADVTDVSAQSAPILDGQLAPEATSVVGVVNFAGGQCSGSLLLPNLVLTARHCIASSEDDTTAVVCDDTMLESPDSAGAVFVVPLPQISNDPLDYHAVSAIRTPEGATSVCGSDVALLQLSAPLTLPTLTPRLDSPLVAGEPYSIVGYGVNGSQASGASGIRRSRAGLSVECVGAECDQASVYANEWVGPTGACSGDSGGPALDADGRVIGVLSRGKEACTSPVYAQVFAYAEWLRAAGASAAEAGRYHAPTWVCPDCAVAQPSLGSSCTVAPRGAPSTFPFAASFAALLAFALRRRR